MAQQEQHILYDKEDGIGIITLNRPEKMNAVTDDMLADLTNIITDIIIIRRRQRRHPVFFGETAACLERQIKQSLRPDNLYIHTEAYKQAFELLGAF